jgi:hypothetical protein
MKGSSYLDLLIMPHTYLHSEHFVDLVPLFWRQTLESLRNHTSIGLQEGLLVSFQPLYALSMAPKRL